MKIFIKKNSGALIFYLVLVVGTLAIITNNAIQDKKVSASNSLVTQLADK